MRSYIRGFSSQKQPKVELNNWFLILGVECFCLFLAVETATPGCSGYI